MIVSYRGHILVSTVAVCFFVSSCTAGLPSEGDRGLVGYWTLQGDCRDHSGMGNHGTNHGADLSNPNAAKFNGRDSYIEVPDRESIRLGAADFCVSAWVKCNSGARVTGDVVHKYDSDRRKGLNLSISTSSPGYSSVSDSRNVFFGIDNAVEGDWVDCGRPSPGNTLISTLIVYQGQLYTGIADATNAAEACHVFRYAGEKKWVDCGRVGNDLKTPSIYSVVVHEGRLYAGTGVWDWEKAWASNSGPTHVYCYAGGTKWTDCGQFGAGYRVMSLASFDGKLYAADDKGFVFRHDGDKVWTECGRLLAQQKIMSMMPYRGELYGGANTSIHRREGSNTLTTVGAFDAKIINQVHTLEVYRGNLFAGTWPEGKTVRYEADNRWADCGNVGIDTVSQKINEINDLTVYNGKLYSGVIPKGEVWRYEGGKQWTLVKQLVQNPDWSATNLPSWNRVPCLTVFQGRLFAGTSTCHGLAEAAPKTDAGKVFSWEAGKSVSYDDDIGTDWRHIVAVRQKGRLRLYLDGKLVGDSPKFDRSAYDLTNGNPFLIGSGAENYFSGSIRKVRLYNRALDAAEVFRLFKREK